MYIRESIQFNGKELVLETGKLARQATGAVLAKHGDTQVLVTVVTAEPRRDIGYFPLRVDYEERFYAAGKIPGGFFKREGRPSDVAILSGRMIDRPIRPLFPKGYKQEVQIIATVLSADPECSPNSLAILGASAALSISDAPFYGPIAGVKVGYVEGEFILDPGAEVIDETGVEITVAGTRDNVTMVEGMMTELTEDEVVAGIDFAHRAIRDLVGLQERFVARVQPVKAEYVEPEADVDEPTLERVRSIVWPEFPGIHAANSKKARGEFLEGLRARAAAQMIPASADEEEIEETTGSIAKAMDILLNEYMRQQILDRGIRLDGRGPEDIRTITCETGLLPRTHGSSLFTRGETQSLGIVTLGATRNAEQIIDQMMFDGRKRFMLHYNFPPYSVGEAGRVGSPSRRSVGHGYLAENSLRNMMPDQEDFPYVVRIVSEILESNGSSSMATVCSASMAMMAAGVPLAKPVAGIAMGMIEDPVTQRRVVLTDIQGAEDHFGDMDFKVVGTRDGVTGFQLDVKVGGIDSSTMRQALEQAKRARLSILAEMDKAISAPREELSMFAPRLISISIPQDKIGLVIGPGGKTIRQIIEETGAQIDIDDDGTAKLAGPDQESVAAAKQWIEDLTTELEVGTVLKTKVTRVVDFGAFVELKGGGEGLVHVSNLASGFVDNVRDIVSPGDEITIEVIGEDKMGRPDLKRLEEGDTPGTSKPREPREPRSDKRGRRDRNNGGRGGSKPSAPAAPAPEIKAGDIITGPVTNTTDYGAFVELGGDVTGLVHISALSDEYVRRVTDVVKPGDIVTVEVLNIDERGRYKLRRIVPDSEKKAVAEEAEAEAQPEETPEEPKATEPEAPVVPEKAAPEEAPVQKEEAPAKIEEEPTAPEFEDRW